MVVQSSLAQDISVTNGNGLAVFRNALDNNKLYVKDSNGSTQSVDSFVVEATLNMAGDTGTGSVETDTQTLNILGTLNEIETIVSNNTITIGLPPQVKIATSLQILGGNGSAGTISWNAEDETYNVILNQFVTNQLGQEINQLVRNISGTTLVNGSVVRVTGASGNKITVDLASNNIESLSSTTIALATQTISNNSTGFVTTDGLVRDIDTSAIPEGTALWLGTNGNYTSEKPLSPAHLVLLGWVVRSHATEGSIYVHVSNGWELEELHDVLIQNVENNQILAYNSTTFLWENSFVLSGMIANNNVTYDKIDPSFKSKDVKGNVSGNVTSDWSLYVTFVMTLIGNTTLEVNNPKQGMVKNYVISGASSGFTLSLNNAGGETFYVTNGTYDDTSLNNFIQIECIDDTAGSEIFYLSISQGTSASIL